MTEIVVQNRYIYEDTFYCAHYGTTAIHVYYRLEGWSELRASAIKPKIFFLCGSCSLVYFWKQSLFQRPQPFIKSLVANSGKRLKVLGIPARKEWQEIESTPGTQMSASIVASTLLK